MVTVGNWPRGKRMAFAVRDDDLSYFTRREMLEQVHGHAWQGGVKVTFSAIPNHKGGASLAVPPEMRSDGTYHRIMHNEELVRFIREGITQERFDVVQHGYAHSESMGPPMHFDLEKGSVLDDHDRPIDQTGRSEFYGLDRSEVHRRVHMGRQDLESTFAHKVRVFVPPFDLMSRPLFEAMLEERMHYCGGIDARSLRLLPFWTLRPRNILRAMVRSRKGEDISMEVPDISLMVTLPITFDHAWRRYRNQEVADTSTSDFDRILRERYQASSYFIMLVRSWELFYDWEREPTRSLQLRCYHEQLDQVERLGDVWHCGLNELADWIYRRKAVVIKERADRTTIESPTGIHGLSIEGAEGEITLCRASVIDRNRDMVLVDIGQNGQVTIRK
jgi:predicted deacetylase